MVHTVCNLELASQTRKCDHQRQINLPAFHVSDTGLIPARINGALAATLGSIRPIRVECSAWGWISKRARWSESFFRTTSRV